MQTKAWGTWSNCLKIRNLINILHNYCLLSYIFPLMTFILKTVMRAKVASHMASLGVPELDTEFRMPLTTLSEAFITRIPLPSN